MTSFTLVELNKLSLEPGEVLAVKLYGDDYEQEAVTILQEQLKKVFPNNRIMMFVLPVGHDLQMEKISASMENKDLGQLGNLTGLGEMASCSEPQSYCSDCSCGKKERIEGTDESKPEGDGTVSGES